MSHQDVEFEFLMEGRASIMDLNLLTTMYAGPRTGRIGIKVDTSRHSTIQCYQDWNIKTVGANRSPRKVFKITYGEMNTILNNISNKGIDFKPSTVIKFDSNTFTIVTIEKMIIHENVTYLVINRNFCDSAELNFSDNTHVTLNLSSLPYNLIDVDHIYSGQNIPWGKHVESTIGETSNHVQFDEVMKSYLLTNNGNITIKDGIVTIEIPSSASVLGYQQWSVNTTNLNNNATRQTECLDLADQIPAIAKFKKEHGFDFTPTTTLYIGSQISDPIYGVITDMRVSGAKQEIGTQMGTSSLMQSTKFNKFHTNPQDINPISGSSEMIVITIDTNAMYTVDSQMRVANAEYTQSNFYMNIDDTATPQIISVEVIGLRMSSGFSGGTIYGGEKLVLPDRDGRYLTDLPKPKSSFLDWSVKNQGIIAIAPYMPENNYIGGIYKTSDTPLVKNPKRASKVVKSDDDGLEHQEDLVYDKPNYRTSIYVPDNGLFANYGVIKLAVPDHPFVKDDGYNVNDVDHLSAWGLKPYKTLLHFKNRDKMTNSFYFPMYGLTENLFFYETNLAMSNNIIDSYINVDSTATFINTGVIDFTLPLTPYLGLPYVDEVISGQGSINFAINNADFDFSYITDLFNSNGTVLFDTIVNKTSRNSFQSDTVVCGIKNLLQSNSASDLKNMVFIQSVQSLGLTSQTHGITNCWANYGQIIIDNVYAGQEYERDIPSDFKYEASPLQSNDYESATLDLKDYEIPNYYNGSGYQETYGIKNIGTINPTIDTSSKPQLIATMIHKKLFKVHSMITPEVGYSFDGKTSADDAIASMQNAIFDMKNIVTVSGNYGNIFINKVVNASPMENLDSFAVCCGIGKMIQLFKRDMLEKQDFPSIHIKHVLNLGYGGEIACVGIQNVLLNLATICVDTIENYTPTTFEGENPTYAVGISSVVQNGYSSLNPATEESDIDHLYAYLPPYPPQNFNTEGEPEKIDYAVTIQYPGNKRFIDNVLFHQGPDRRFAEIGDGNWQILLNPEKGNYYNPGKRTVQLNNLYNQGHISIGIVNNLGINDSVAEGIDRYGGLSYNQDIFSNFGYVHDITAELFEFIQTFINSSVMYSFPTSENTTIFENPLMIDAEGITSAENLRKTGWFPDRQFKSTSKRYAPSQMYFAYNTALATSSNIILFPMNWGVLTIDNVHSGSNMIIDKTNENGLKFTVKKETASLFRKVNDFPPVPPEVANGSMTMIEYLDEVVAPKWGYGEPNHFIWNKGGEAYGVERLMSSLGRIQIMEVRSDNEVTEIPRADGRNYDITKIRLVNTPEHPELSEYLGMGQGHFFDLPSNFFGLDIYNNFNRWDGDYNYASDDGEKWGVKMDDMKVSLFMVHNNVTDPTSKSNGVWMNGTERTINYRFPYSMVFNEGPTYYSSPARNNFKNNFKPSTDFFGESRLDNIKTRGGSYGVYRTIDYGTAAPGLRLFMDYSKPLKESSHFADYYLNKGWDNIIQPFAPTNPVGFSLFNVFYQSGMDHSRGGQKLQWKYPTLFGNVFNGFKEYDPLSNANSDTHYINLPFEECKMCILYTLDSSTSYTTTTWGYNDPYDSTIFKESDPIGVLPIFIGDGAGEGYENLNLKTKGSVLSGADKDKYIFENSMLEIEPVTGILKTNEDPDTTTEFISDGLTNKFWAGKKYLHKTTKHAISFLEFANLYQKSGYDFDKMDYEIVRGSFKTIDGVELDIIDPHFYYGGVHQFLSYWMAMSGTDIRCGDNQFWKAPITKIPSEDPDLLRPSETSPSGWVTKSQKKVALFGNKHSVNFKMPFRSLVNRKNTPKGNKEVKSGDCAEIYPEDLSNRNDWIYKKWNNAFKTNKTFNKRPSIINSEFIEKKREMGLYVGDYHFSVHNLDGYKDTRFDQPHSKPYSNPYYYEEAHGLRGPLIYDNDQVRHAMEYPYLYNVFQGGLMVPPKYTWNFDTNKKNNPVAKQGFVNGLVDSNIFPSSWPGSQNLPVLMENYMKIDLTNRDEMGKAGPYDKYSSYRKDAKTGRAMYWEDYMGYLYTPCNPPGFMPQYLQGGLLYLNPEKPTNRGIQYDSVDDPKPSGSNAADSLVNITSDTEIRIGFTSSLVDAEFKEHKQEDDQVMEYRTKNFPGSGETSQIYNSILAQNYSFNPIDSLQDSRGEFNLIDPRIGAKTFFGGAIGTETFGSGCTGFTSLTSGNKVLSSIRDPSSYFKVYSSVTNKNHHQDNDCQDKWDTSNSYYGFTYEHCNFEASRKYNQYYMFLGPYSKYSQINKAVSTYLAENYTNKFSTFSKNLNVYMKQASKFEHDYLERIAKQNENRHGFWSKLTNVIMIMAVV